MKVQVIYEPTEWYVEWFDEPWFWVCTHPGTVDEDALSFDGETVETITKCADKNCEEVLLL